MGDTNRGNGRAAAGTQGTAGQCDAILGLPFKIGGLLNSIRLLMIHDFLSNWKATDRLNPLVTPNGHFY